MLLAGALATVVACFGVAPAEAVRIRCCSTQDTSSLDTVSGIPVLAAMVANPEDLITGQKGTGETVVSTSTKAIKAYRDLAPTGATGGLAEVNTQEGG